MELVELTEYLIKNLVEDKDNVKVEVVNSDDVIVIEVKVAEQDMGSVIGRGGNIANSIRTIIQAAAYNRNLGRVKININVIEG